MLTIEKKRRAGFDAIVIGSGISGGWAAKELCEKGLKTLLLERGRDVQHVIDYQTAMMHPWEFRHRLQPTQADLQESPIQSLVYDSGSKDFFVKDSEHPYKQSKPFNWIRGYQVGGRSLVWGRQCYRLSDLDFEANRLDGHGVDWPIRYQDITSWYDYVEKYIGVSGRQENLPQLPDGIYLPPMELNCIEKHLANSLRKNGKTLTIARVANLTQSFNGRGPCLYRNLCSRGCPYGAYFSSNSSTIPAAASTGNLTLRPHFVVHEIVYDEQSERAKGVRGVDALTGEAFEYDSKIIFLNASTIATAAILLNSKSARFPSGLGNDSDQVGRNLMDHHSSAGASGEYEGFDNYYYSGRRPCGFLIPRFRNISNDERNDYLRGYNIQGIGRRKDWTRRIGVRGFGDAYKQQLVSPGPWEVWMAGWGECLPNPENRVTLDFSTLDQWGMPLVNIDFSFGENERRMRRDIQNVCAEMLDEAGFRNIQTFDDDSPGGSTIHEMGTARMGNDPDTSVLNAFNQMHTVKNVFITDGSCMSSSACQNPSLTYMALTVRACDYAVRKLKTNEL